MQETKWNGLGDMKITNKEICLERGEERNQRFVGQQGIMSLICFYHSGLHNPHPDRDEGCHLQSPIIVTDTHTKGLVLLPLTPSFLARSCLLQQSIQTSIPPYNFLDSLSIPPSLSYGFYQYMHISFNPLTISTSSIYLSMPKPLLWGSWKSSLHYPRPCQLRQHFTHYVLIY